MSPGPADTAQPADAGAALAGEARRFLAGLGDATVTRFLAEWPGGGAGVRRVEPASLPVTAWLPAAMTAAGARGEGLVRALADAAPRLRWGQTYAPEDFGASFLERYGWTELVGARGPVPGASLACGFLLLAPRTGYPRHSHDAEEVYVPLTGPAGWMSGDRPFVQRPADVPIHHPSRMPHAMRTGDVPLVALYLWRGGDLAQKSSIGSTVETGEATPRR